MNHNVLYVSLLTGVLSFRIFGVLKIQLPNNVA